MLAKNQKLVIVFFCWILAVLAILILFQSLSYEFFFILSFIGFLIIVELSGPFMARTGWRSRVNVVILIGVVVFAAIVFNRVMEIVGRYL